MLMYDGKGEMAELITPVQRHPMPCSTVDSIPKSLTIKAIRE